MNIAKEEQVDLHLITAVQEGDKQAFNELMTKYQYKVFKVVARYVRNPSEVMDVTQEIFIKVYKSLENFQGTSAFYTWLYRIAVNTAKNYIVSQGRKLPEVDFDITDMEQFFSRGALNEYCTPEKMLLCDEIEDTLHEVIDNLPGELRTAIMLRELEGLSYNEIAHIMHCPIGTVRSRIFRARSAIETKVNPFLTN